jgi:cyclic-di-GMP phosphodiesterase TipF (flagellum assembly factor)
MFVIQHFARVNDPNRADLMSRFADLFVAVCIVAVSASVGIVMYYQMDLPPIASVLVVIVLAVMLMIVNIRSLRMQDRTMLNESVETMTRRLNQVTAEFESLERRISSLEISVPRRARQDLEPVVAEVEVIGALIRQVVETVADLEAQIGVPTRARTTVSAQVDVLDMNTPPTTDRGALDARPGGDPDLVPKRFMALGEAGFLELIKSAIDANRIDINLQPIVTLPQRKIRFYETLTRLRTVDGETIDPADYIPLAEKTGLMPSLDNQILLRTMQVLRRLMQRTKDVGIFCNISATSLGDGQFFSEFIGFLEANRHVADDLIFEFTQQSLKALGPIEFEGLRAIQGLGFKFSIDRIQDMRSSFQFLSERGFRYAKIAADRLLTGGEALATDIHAADLANYFSRFGMELIADHIETEAQVVDVLDFAVKYGQGFLFSPPRPVKSEITAANSDILQSETPQKSRQVTSGAADVSQGSASRVPSAATPPMTNTQSPRRAPSAPPPPTPQQTTGPQSAEAIARAAAKARQIAGQSTVR